MPGPTQRLWVKILSKICVSWDAKEAFIFRWINIYLTKYSLNPSSKIGLVVKNGLNMMYCSQYNLVNILSTICTNTLNNYNLFSAVLVVLLI